MRRSNDGCLSVSRRGLPDTQDRPQISQPVGFCTSTDRLSGRPPQTGESGRFVRPHQVGQETMANVPKVSYVLILLACLATPLEAGVITFDFEDQTATALPRTGALTNLTLTQSGLTIEISRGGVPFDIVDNVGGQAKPPEFGQRSLDPFFILLPVPFIIDFSIPVTSFSVDMGDYGQDSDNLLLEAFAGLGGTGALLASDTDFLLGGGTAFSFKTLAVTSPTPFRSIRMIGGGVDLLNNLINNSVFYDNLQASAVPEPSTFALWAIASVALAGYSLRRRQVRIARAEKTRM